MTLAKTHYRFVGTHVDDLADGRILEPGQFIDLTDEEATDPHNALRIEAGLLIEVEKKQPASRKEGDN